MDDDIRRSLGEALPFRSLEPEVLDGLAAQATIRGRKAGTIVWSWGQRADELGVVLAGTLEISRRLPNGRDSLVRTLGRGDVVGYSVVAGEPHSADVRARSDVRLAVLDGSDVRKLFRECPEVALGALAELGHLVSTLTDELAGARFDSLTDQVRAALYRLCDESRRVRMTHEELASSVGAERANVSRALRRLVDEGGVELGRGWIRIIEPHRRSP